MRESKSLAKEVALWIESSLTVDRLRLEDLPYEIRVCRCHEKEDKQDKQLELDLEKGENGEPDDDTLPTRDESEVIQPMTPDSGNGKGPADLHDQVAAELATISDGQIVDGKTGEVLGGDGKE